MKKILLTMLLTSCFSASGAEQEIDQTIQEHVDALINPKENTSQLALARDLEGLQQVISKNTFNQQKIARAIKEHPNYNVKGIAFRISELKDTLGLPDSLFTTAPSQSKEDSKSEKD